METEYKYPKHIKLAMEQVLKEMGESVNRESKYPNEFKCEFIEPKSSKVPTGLGNVEQFVQPKSRLDKLVEEQGERITKIENNVDKIITLLRKQVDTNDMLLQTLTTVVQRLNEQTEVEEYDDNEDEYEDEIGPKLGFGKWYLCVTSDGTLRRKDGLIASLDKVSNSEYRCKTSPDGGLVIMCDELYEIDESKLGKDLKSLQVGKLYFCWNDRKDRGLVLWYRGCGFFNSMNIGEDSFRVKHCELVDPKTLGEGNW